MAKRLAATSRGPDWLPLAHQSVHSPSYSGTRAPHRALHVEDRLGGGGEAQPGFEPQPVPRGDELGQRRKRRIVVVAPLVGVSQNQTIVVVAFGLELAQAAQEVRVGGAQRGFVGEMEIAGARRPKLALAPRGCWRLQFFASNHA